MATQTEKLEAQLTGLLNSPVNSWKPTHILVRQILAACKEAGLKFTRYPKDDLEGASICNVEEIELKEEK